MKVTGWISLALVLFGVVTTANATASDTWKVEGRDGDKWTADLVLLEESDDGYFDWKSDYGASGRELVTYTYDEKTRTLRLYGRELIDPKGNIVRSQYKATLSKDGKRLVDGTWWGPGVVPGTWSATR